MLWILKALNYVGALSADSGNHKKNPRRSPLDQPKGVHSLGLLAAASFIHEPLHSRVRQLLRRHLLNDFEDGARFYSERELVKLLEVSQLTVRRAMVDLASEGYLVPSSRRGFFVKKNVPTRHVGVFVPAYRPVLSLERVENLAHVCREEGIEMHLYHLQPHDKAEAALKMIRNPASDERIILLGLPEQLSTEMADKLGSHGYSFIFSSEILSDYPGKSVGLNEEVGIDLILDHLIKLGHRRMLFLINEPLELITTRVRATIIQARLQSLGYPETSLVSCGTKNWGNSFDAAYAKTGEILARRPWPTAICPLSGVGAWAVMRYCFEKGIRIPQDISLVSYDPLPGNDLLPVALTTLSRSESEMAREMVTLLWSNTTEQSRTLIKPTLIARASTGPALDAPKKTPAKHA